MRAGTNNLALRTLDDAGRFRALRDHQDALTLDAWDMATRIRAANTLAKGRMSGVKLDVLP